MTRTSPWEHGFSGRLRESCARRISPRSSRWLRKCGSHGNSRKESDAAYAQHPSRRQRESDGGARQGQDRASAFRKSVEEHGNRGAYQHHQAPHAPESAKEREGRNRGQGSAHPDFERAVNLSRLRQAYARGTYHAAGRNEDADLPALQDDFRELKAKGTTNEQ